MNIVSNSSPQIASQIQSQLRIRVLVVIETLGFGGAERLLVSLIPDLKKEGIDIEVAALWPPYSLASELEEAGAIVHRFDLSNRFQFLKAFKRIKKIVQTNKIDILWGHLYFGNLYSSFFRLFKPSLRIVITHHNSAFSTLQPKSLWEFIRVGLEVVGGKYLAQKTVAVSRSVAEAYQKAFHWQQIAVVHNGIPCAHLPEPLQPQEIQRIRSTYGIAESDFLAIIPARLAPEKGLQYLIDSMGILKRQKQWTPKCYFLGTGPLKDSLGKRAQELGVLDSVVFLGNVKQDILFDLIQSADAVILPSIQEPFGIAAAEAMALNCPCIVSKVDGLIELVGDSNLVTFSEPGNPKSIADGIWDVYKDQIRARDMALNARSHVQQNFDIPIVAKAWKRIFYEEMGF